MDNTQLAWIAGLVDGEGSLSIKRVTRESVVHYQVWVVIGMAHISANRSALEEIQSVFGGNMVVQKEHTNPNRQDKIAWTVVSQMALTFLRSIQPYLRIKKEHARLLIEFQETCISRTGKKKVPGKLARQEAYFYELRKLTTRGSLRLQRLNEETPKGEATV